MTKLFEFISSDGVCTDWRHIPTRTRISIRYIEGRPVASVSGGVISNEMLKSFNDWRMAKHITDIGMMQQNAARYGYDDPAQIARDYPAPRPAIAKERPAT